MASRVLLTGANGFVGSRVVARLINSGISAVLLLRRSSNRHLLDPLPPQVTVLHGSVEDVATLEAALDNITHVIHCAGRTKALRWEDYETVNVTGTRNLVQAVNRQPGIHRLIHISSLAAHGPGGLSNPARETDPPAPVSLYGRSKLLGEQEVLAHCQVPFTVIRPPGVYGPGDGDFLQLFQTVRRGFCPVFDGGRQPLSLVHVDDLAQVIVACLDRDPGALPVFHVAHPVPVTAAELAKEVARQLGVRPRVVPLPGLVLTLAAGAGELKARLTRKPSILSLDRLKELQAPGWVCDTTHLREGLGLECPTALPQGLASTAAWYRKRGWL